MNVVDKVKGAKGALKSKKVLVTAGLALLGGVFAYLTGDVDLAALLPLLGDFLLSLAG